MLPQQYCLRWRYHHSNLQTMFSQLLEREAFCDVTLACDGRTIKAHKIVLSACSTYFDTILSQYEEKDPILIMKDVKYVDIKCLVEFMYKGEINVDHCHLATLLKTAEDLRIKGLAEVSWRDGKEGNVTGTANSSSSNAGTSSASSAAAAAAASTAAAAAAAANQNGIQTALANVATVMGGSPKDGSVRQMQQMQLQQQLTANKRKRGRPPIDDYDGGYTLAPKIISVMSGSNAEESANSNDGTSASEHDNDQDRGGGGGGGGLGGNARSASQWEDDDDRINSFGEHMLSGIRVKTELNTEDEYVDYDHPNTAQHLRHTRTSIPTTSTSSSTTTNPASTPNHHNNTPGNLNLNNISTPTPQSIMSQLEKEWPDVIRLNDYLNTGRRQQFWEEPFTKRVMDAIKTKNLEMKSAAELLGVSYGTLYGRYRDAYGCLKHPYSSLSRSGLLVKVPGNVTPNANAPGGNSNLAGNWVRDFWSEQGPTDIIMKLKRKEITLFKAAEQLKVSPQTLSNYLISVSMAMDPEMASSVAKLLAQSGEDGTGPGQLQLQLQQQMPPLRRLHSGGSHHDDGSILGDEEEVDDGEVPEEEDEEEEEEHEEVLVHPDDEDEDEEEEDSILPDIPNKGGSSNHSIIGTPSALANCPDITIIRKEKMDQLIGRVNNNDHSDRLKAAGSNSSAAGTAT